MINRIEYSITDQCNLNCASCCHYASICKPYSVSVESFAKDMKRLANLTLDGWFLDTLGILGGEPLLHKHFIEICVIARTALPYSRIRVTTNGLLLNKLTKQELCILRRYDIEILISKYRDTDDFDAMDKLLTEYNIVHKFCQNGNLVEFCKYSIDETGSQNINEMHKLCTLWQEQPYYTCHELRDGKIYPCSQIARADSLNAAFDTTLKVEKDCYLNIHSHTCNLIKLEVFLKQSCSFCKYCKVNEWSTPIGKWRKSEKKKEEFI